MCGVRLRHETFTLGDHRIAAVGCMLTTRAAKWVVKQIGGRQRPSAIWPENWAAVGTSSTRAMLHLRRRFVAGRHQAPERDDGYRSGRDLVRARRSLQEEVVVDDGL